MRTMVVFGNSMFNFCHILKVFAPNDVVDRNGGSNEEHGKKNTWASHCFLIYNGFNQTASAVC